MNSGIKTIPSMTAKPTLLANLNSLPPPIVRLLCPLTEREISKASGLHVQTIRRLSGSASWNGNIETVSSFLEACGISVKLTIPALSKVKRIMNSKRGVAGVRHPTASGRKSQAIKRIVRVLK